MLHLLQPLRMNWLVRQFNRSRKFPNRAEPPWKSNLMLLVRHPSIRVMKLSWNTLNKTRYSRQFEDNCLDMGQKRHPSVHNHSKIFDLISSFACRPINRINELNSPHIAAKGYRFAFTSVYNKLRHRTRPNGLDPFETTGSLKQWKLFYRISFFRIFSEWPTRSISHGNRTQGNNKRLLPKNTSRQ
jgi:hypothetical protein